MPSPFPGVDPFIEAQGLWPDFHLTMINYLREAVADRLPDRYDARIDQRIRLVEEGIPTRDVRPDAAILRDDHGPAPGEPQTSGGTMLLEPVTLTLPTRWVEEREAWIEIREGTDRSLVTVIEILSPSNKTGTGQGEYAAKRRELIRQDVHIVELDLLLAGERLPVVEPLPPGEYYAYVARSDHRPQCSVYAWSIRRPLPTIPIPQRAPDPDIPIDLGAVLQVAYARGHLRQAIRYDRPLELPLSASDRAWAEAVARGAA